MYCTRGCCDWIHVGLFPARVTLLLLFEFALSLMRLVYIFFPGGNIGNFRRDEKRLKIKQLPLSPSVPLVLKQLLTVAQDPFLHPFPAIFHCKEARLFHSV